ncbi:MAG: hypothetical protein AAGK22_25395 [Acidobacteriota bacterium]
MRALVAIVGLLAASTLSAQSPEPQLAEELKALRLAVESLAKSLSAEREVRRAELLLKRAEIENADLQPWQARAQKTRDDIRELEEDREAVERQMDAFERMIFDAETQEEEDDLRSQLEGMRAYGDRLDLRIAEAEAAAAGAESQVGRRRALLETLKARIDEALDIDP